MHRFRFRRFRLCVAAPACVAAVTLSVCGAASHASAQTQASASPLAACAPANEDQQWTSEQFLCLYRKGVQHDRLDEARARLRALGGGRPEHPWPTLALAYATQHHDGRQAILLYEMAAEGFVRVRDALGEVLARHNLRNAYWRRGDAALARRHVERALAAVEASKQPEALARASVLEASHLIESGGDLGRAYRALRRAERVAFPAGPIGLRRSILFNLANASLYLGRYDDAIDALERHRALRKEDGAQTEAAMVAFNLLNARLTKNEERPRPGARARLIAEANEVLLETQRLKRPAVEARVHRVLADLLRTSDPEQAANHVTRCLELEASLGQPELRAGCYGSLSLTHAARDPVRAERHSQQSLAASASNPGGPTQAFAWRTRLRLVWQTMGEEEAIPASLEALDAIERLRAAQPDEGSRAALFSNWTSDYYWLTGRLLSAPTPRVAQAFEIGERLRTRVLLERLSREGIAAPLATQGEASAASVEAVPAPREAPFGSVAAMPAPPVASFASAEAVTALRKGSFGSPKAVTPPREASFGSADAVATSREASFGSTEAVTAPRPASVASVAAVQQALDAREALVWFSIAPWTDVYGDFGGGAWVVSVTRDDVAVHRLPASLDLQSQVPAFVGLLRERDMPADRWEQAASHLGAALLGSTIAGLPPDIQRLVVVSDGNLHRLPFDAIRPAADQPRLGERYDITLVPSATLWLHLRRLSAPPASSSTRGAGALVLADPELPPKAPADGLRLDRLPWARREARAIARALRLESDRIREGRDASERFLKTAPLGGVAIVHLAAHARADETFPDRSAVFLAPGDPAEDGWLQPSEIASLDLRGRLVVLSACDSAEGFLLSGEGPLSLARAFFAGGASAVVATRWPLRDDDAAFMMERLYRALGSSARLDEALRSARREAIESGRPAAAWAGLVLLGDGRRAPIPPGDADAGHRGPAAIASWLVTVTGALIAIGAGAILWVARHAKPRARRRDRAASVPR